ncbi:spatacsin [Chelonus insularis]|uniref:spatacsin n=1 Tax=Chelonus insularis TaxID=460826 RepID=UPI00158C9161|nr:spatacsin [Chelonus insularis]XP_034936277.1 spatacsin [Chelonus insularis]
MESIGGIPVECLKSGELSRIWSGWSLMKDREVIREASAKGTHIDLAYQFLSHRNSWNIDEAKNYFDEQVKIWIDELINKHQVHRASHILQNIKKDPLDYMRQICVTSTNFEVRNYLISFLIPRQGLTKEDTEVWEIIKYLKLYEEKHEKISAKCLKALDNVELNYPKIDNISIREILNLPCDVKNSLITELYFLTNEPCLLERLEPDVVWNYLLSNDDIKLLIDWIDIQMNDKKSIVILRYISEVFNRFKISDKMIEDIDYSSASIPVKEILLNYFARFGKLIEKEKRDVKLTLSRLFSAQINFSEFEKVLYSRWCDSNEDHFFARVHSIIYYQNTSNDYNEELYLNDQELLDVFNKLNQATHFDQKEFNLAICKTINRISDNSQEYLKENPFMLFYLFLSNFKNYHNFKDIEMVDTSFTELNFKELNKLIKNLFTNLPYFKEAIDKVSQKDDITMYQMLQGFENLDVYELFKWRQKGEVLPNFRSENLIKRYGHKEELTYKYYLKEARPSMAAYIFQNRHNKIQNNYSKIKSRIALHSHILGLKNINDRKVISTCIAFIEFLGINSEYLRFHVTAADYVKNNLNISINDLLESVTYQNSKNLAILMSHLERSFKNECDNVSINDVDKFITVLKSWNLIIQFASLHNTIYPSLFLKYFARNKLWFEFVLVGHIFSYPLEQLLENAAEFKDLNIREHLLISLSNSHILAEACTNNDLSKIKPSLNLYKTHMKNGSSLNHMTESSSNLQYFPLNQINCIYNHNLWVTILKYHQSPDPPGALLKASRENNSPILTILAACYEPSATSVYCYSWLIISVNNSILTNDYIDCLKDQIWSPRKVSDLFRRVISLGYIDTISRAFQIFMPDNCLCAFFNFLVQYIKHCEFKVCIKYLESFLISCSLLKSNKMIDWDDSEMAYTNNEYWIAIVSIECILTALGKCLQSIELQTKLLAILVENKFNSLLHFDKLNFKMLWEIVTSLESTNVKINFTAIRLTENSSNIREEVEKCIEALMGTGNFNVALELAKIVGLPCSKIILNQYRNRLKSKMMKKDEENGKFDKTFWKRCALDIQKYNVGFEDAAAFFVEHADRVQSDKERYEILHLAHEILKPISTHQQTLDTIEMAMWKACILAGPNSIEIETEKRSFNKLKTELLSEVSNLQVSCILYNKNEEKAVEALINRFIDAEDLEKALRISAIFNYQHTDLKILMLCLSLAEGEISPKVLNIEYKMLLNELDNAESQRFITKSKNFQKRYSGYFSNLSSPNRTLDKDLSTSISSSQEIVDESGINCITLLTKLKMNLKYQSNVANKILLLCRLSEILKKSYNSLLTLEDPMKILSELTTISHENKFDLMQDVINIYKLKDKEVTKFFTEQIILHITTQVGEDLDDSIAMWNYPLSNNLLILSFCNDASLIGWELIKNVNVQFSSSYTLKKDEFILKVIVELLIHAHYFFTFDCNMEGIAYVLRKCRVLSHGLQQLKLWNLLVRLMTGIGRFTEMNYILQILKENHQFELLLRKRLVNRSGLRIALLEFCKKQYPNDKESFSYVAEHFLLYTENAIRWENEAKTVIRELIKEIRRERIRLMNNFNGPIKLTKKNRIEEKLEMAMSNYTHASENYLNDDKLNMASRCSHQAQLIALQLSLLNSVSYNQEAICLLDLNDEEVARVMSQSLTFPQILILIEAYNHNADWSSLIYHHVILNGDIKFLKDFLANKRLTSAIVQDCVCKYRAEKCISKQMTLSMQSLISELTDVECKYILASQLGFKNIIESMLSDSAISSYLKDTVWKRGFNPQKFIGENFHG